MLKQEPTPLRLTIRLILAAAAIPLAPLSAQENQTQTPVDITPPPAPAPAPAETPPVADTVPAQQSAPAETAPPVAEEAPARRQRARPSTAVEPSADATVQAAADPLAATAPVPAPVAEAVPTAQLPATVVPAPGPEVLPPGTPPAAGPQQSEGGISPELLAGALALAGLAAIAFLFTRRRRRRTHGGSYGGRRTSEGPAAVPAVAAAPLAFERETHAEESVAAPSAVAPLAGVRPWLDLAVRAVRAGVGEENACVEFELTVHNTGSAPAEDVRISTFLLAGGSSQRSEMEQARINPPPEARFPEPIDAGDAKRISAAVALPRNGLAGAILPVVIADARYRLPDGSEGRTSAAFAVGVPWGEELAHFDTDNPSGLHEGVEARPQGEPQRV